MMMLIVMVAAALQAGVSSAPAKRTQSGQRAAPAAKTVARTAVQPRAATTSVSRPPKTRQRVVVDAGHGGRDPGGPMRGAFTEKEIALQVALKVGDALRMRGIDVVYTRTTDTLVGRADRGRIANRARGDVFISIHVNAANPGWKDPAAARGFETYFLGVSKTEDAQRVEEMEEQSARFESEGPVASNDALGFILNDMIQNEHLRESSDFAEIVQRHLRSVHPGPDRGVKQAAFTVLVSALMPAILVELGFGTNAEEAAFMAAPSKQREMARAIAEATAEYLERHQRRVGSGSGAASGSHD
jgi:N-acetylmuramoyl-L-alanine amidase